MICTPYQYINWVIKLRRMRWVGHLHVWERGEVYTEFWWGNLSERERLGDTGDLVEWAHGLD